MKKIQWFKDFHLGWVDLFAAALESSHFDARNCVYIIWINGSGRRILSTGTGAIRHALEQRRQSAALAPFRDQKVVVSWIVVPPEEQDGIRRFLHELLRPELDNGWSSLDEPIPVQSLP